MTEFNTGLPSTRQIQGLIKDKKEVELKLSTDELLVGQILWQDPNCICLVERDNRQTIIWYQAIVYLKPKL